MTNAQIARTLDRVAELLAQQAALAFRVRAWRLAARTVRESPRELSDVFRDHGRVGLEALPHIGPRLAAVIIELVKTGRCGALERLEGDPLRLLASVPGLGPTLADRIHDELGIETLEELEVAVHDGRLARLSGFGPRRIAALGGILASMLSRRPTEAPRAARPSVDLLLAIDAMYRQRAELGELPMIAPRRFNPRHEAWLPILHTERNGFAFTAMFSNTELAHRLGRTHDWVVIYFHDDQGPESQATVVTETSGPLRGQRVVRGREAESEQRPARSDSVRGAQLAPSFHDGAHRPRDPRRVRRAYRRVRPRDAAPIPVDRRIRGLHVPRPR